VEQPRLVIPVNMIERERQGDIDAYRPPEATASCPIIVFIHGGPVPVGVMPTPRDSTIFAGYASLAAAEGAVGVMFDHRLYSIADLANAAEDVSSAVEAARALPGADPDRVALWFFSGGGLLTADWLGNPPPWLRCIAASYPILAAGDDWGADPRFDPVGAVATSDGLPILLTRVGLERPDFAVGVEAFVAAARTHGANLDIIDVTNGQHAFDILDDTDESRAAIQQAVAWVAAKLE
jgi:acetyl esterase/lipase